eukprot:TRINITY_DN12151_c0_g1_i1.p1 TRINITY_DN12151_c0_g1~~TRINITY_DN12151_c0_g1_i1.p1  ORF type:complete len:315 (-),score=42.53 TRINITY_DN12151_c0_g1_i1:150-1094(-)
MAEGRAKASGRVIPDVRESFLWTQRIEKELKVNGKAQTRFSIRNSVSIPDVPSKFKCGHVDPRDAGGLEGFNPAQHGWDPDGPEAVEFRRCMALQAAGSRHRHPYPETMYQEHGWLLAPSGDPAARMRHKKIRNGIGWVWKPPDQWSESTAMAPPIPQEHFEALGSALSAVAPSAVSATAPIQLTQDSAAPSSRVSAAPPAPPQQGSHVSMAPPTSTLSRSAPSAARSVSLPALAASTSLTYLGSTQTALDPGTKLKYREKKLTSAMNESREFLNNGYRGFKWFKPLGQTDVTQFSNDFMKATGGVPIHKYAPR